jgi:hypothetical protein
MAEPELPVPRAKSCDAERAPAASFYARLAADYGEVVDLETVIRQSRRIDPGPDL